MRNLGWIASSALIAVHSASGVQASCPACALGLASAQEVTTTGRVVAWIQDEDGNLLSEGWTVSVFRWGASPFSGESAVDRGRGSATIHGVPPGEYVVLASHRGDRITLESTVVVQGGKAAEICLQGHAIPWEQRLSVGATSGMGDGMLRAFPMTTPALRDRNQEAMPAVRTSPHYWEFGPVEDVDYFLTCTDPRFRFVSSTSLRRGISNKVEATGTSTLRVQATTADGAVAHAVVVRLAGGEQQPWTWYGPLDSFDEVQGLVASTYRLTVGFSAQHIVDVDQVTLVSGETTTIHVAAPAAATLRGRALDSAGEPIARSRLRVREVVDAVELRRATNLGIQPLRLDLITDSAGEFVAGGLPAGLFQVWVAPKDAPYASWTEWLVELPEGGDLSFSLEAGTFGDLRVDCAAVAGGRGVLLELTHDPRDGDPSEDRPILRRTTSARGAAAFERVPVGRYKLIGRSIAEVDVEPTIHFERVVEVAKQRSSFLSITR